MPALKAFFYLPAIAELWNGTIRPEIDTLKLMLTTPAYTAAVTFTETAVDMGVSTDAKTTELVATGYTGGWGGAGRKMVAPTAATDAPNKLLKITFPSVAFGNLGGAINGNIGGCVLIKEGTANDTTSKPILFLQLCIFGSPTNDPLPTNGGPFTVAMDSVNGNAQVIIGGV